MRAKKDNDVPPDTDHEEGEDKDRIGINEDDGGNADDEDDEFIHDRHAPDNEQNDKDMDDGDEGDEDDGGHAHEGYGDEGDPHDGDREERDPKIQTMVRAMKVIVAMVMMKTTMTKMEKFGRGIEEVTIMGNNLLKPNMMIDAKVLPKNVLCRK